MAEVSKNLITELLAVQKELQQKSLKKTAENPFHKSKYVTLNALLDMVLPVLNNHKLVLTQQVTHYEGHPSLTTSVMLNPQEVLESTMLLMLKSEDPQAQGSAITYARRYSLMSLLGLVGDEEDDDGNAATIAATNESEAPQPGTKLEPKTNDSPASDPQKKLIMNTLGRKGYSRAQADEILSNMAGAKVDTITKSQASTVIDWLFKSSKEQLDGYLGGVKKPEDIPSPDDISVEEVPDTP